MYKTYRGVRAQLFHELRLAHPRLAAGELLSCAQAIVDRVLYVYVAQGRQLLPSDTMARVYERQSSGPAGSIWQNLLTIFSSLDAETAEEQHPPCQGRLFRAQPLLSTLTVSDETCQRFRALGQHDFRQDLALDVLGHVFEQSIADLERLRRQAEPRAVPGEPRVGRNKTRSRRQIEGIFYTPPGVRDFVVQKTLGRSMADAWERAAVDRATSTQERLQALESYLEQLRGLRVLDPSCGGGAFLLAALDALAREVNRAHGALRELTGHPSEFDSQDPVRAIVNENLFGVDKSAEAVELTRLALRLSAARPGQSVAPLCRNIRQGNSVVSDPRLDPAAFDWTTGQLARSVEALASDSGWSAGFDVIVGNPPYVRQELLGPYKEHFRGAYAAFHGMADLFVYFVERGLNLLKPGGRLGFVVSNKWLRGGYAQQLRALLGQQCTIETLVDFGHAPIFRDADAFPSVITLRKLAPSPRHQVQVSVYPRAEIAGERLAGCVEGQQFSLVQSSLCRQGFALEPPGVAALLAKLRHRGAPLGQYAQTKPYRGVLTGCNAAFLIDQETRDRLCREDPHSSQVLHKYLRGQDLARWLPEWAGLWMIFARRGIEIDRYPAIRAHLARYRSALEPRPADHRGAAWPGRKPGSYKWYELQDAVDYHALFAQPKIVYQEIQFYPAYCLEREGYFLNNKGFLIPSQDAWLVAVLNSPAMWWHNWRYLVHLKDEALTPAGDKLVGVPIPTPTTAQRELATASVAAVSELLRHSRSAAEAFRCVLKDEHGVMATAPRLARWAELDKERFVRAVGKGLPKDSKPLSAAAAQALGRLFEAHALSATERRARILLHERDLANAVHAAYGLTEQDLSLMRSTAPPRMPSGW